VALVVRLAVLAIGATLAAAGTSQAQGAGEVIAGVRIHGNTVTPDDEILQLAGLVVGEPFGDELLDRAAARLRAAERFESVEVLKRYASISDPTRILVVVLVDEGPVRIVVDPVPGRPSRIVRRRFANLMFMPILGAEDGYGVTYGARFSLNDVAGERSLLSFPLTWGGDKRVAVELQKDVGWPGAPRFTAGALLQRRIHPFFDADADRRRAWSRAEWQLGRALRAGGFVALQRVSLLGDRQTARSVGADVTLDSRLDPLLPRNAIYAHASIERFAFADRSLSLRTLDARGYVGLVGQSVLVVRAQREDASDPAPPYFQSILGGDRNLRGFAAGTEVGDTLVAGSLELRAPLTSPLSVGRFGINAFADTGVAYDRGERLHGQRFGTGFGGGVWMGASGFRLNLEVAHGIGAGTRVHFGAGFGF
jgi:outer membrane protein assembly factor BamA